MKTNKFFAVIMTVISMLSIASFSSCSGYDEDMEEMMKPVNPNNPDNNDGNNKHEGDWGTILDKYFGQETDGKWMSVIVLQKEDGSIVEFKEELPFEYSLGDDEYTTTDNANASVFVETAAADTTSTPWVKTANGNYKRTINRTQQFIFSKFNRTLTSSHCEAYRYINGKQEAFITAIETASFRNLEQGTSEIEKDSKNYSRESNLVTVTLTFHKSTFETSATTYVDREIAKEDVEEPETPNMPDATLTVDNIVKVTTLTSSPEYNANNTKIVKWHTVGLVETSSKYFVYVDGKFTTQWNKNELAASSKYNSAMLENGSWVPAVISMDNGGWSYTCEYANGSYKMRTVSKQLALTSGIKNFTENNSAEVNPFVKTIVDTKEYNGKKYISVSGYTVDAKMYLAYTVAEK